MAYVYDPDDGPSDPLPTAEEVRARVRNWKARLNALYDRIEDWLPADRGFAVNRSLGQPMAEPLMRMTGVDRDVLPILVVRFPDPDRRLGLTPDGLWVYGTNGRLHVAGPVAGRRTYLIDVGTDDNPDWRIYPYRDTRRAVPFDRDEFRVLLGEVS